MKWSKAQSIIDYATLIAVIAMSLIAMVSYLQKSISAKIEMTREDMNQYIDPNPANRTSTSNNSGSGSNTSTGTN